MKKQFSSVLALALVAKHCKVSAESVLKKLMNSDDEVEVFGIEASPIGEHG
jgi:ammonia channel protein AmtB